jgi:hypothetical protein
LTVEYHPRQPDKHKTNKKERGMREKGQREGEEEEDVNKK